MELIFNCLRGVSSTKIIVGELFTERVYKKTC